MKKNRYLHEQTGFTILELLIAMSVFSVMLLVCLATFLQVGQVFSKGVNLTLVQQDARSITGSIISDIQFSNQSPTNINTASGGVHYFCVGQHRYKYLLGRHFGSGYTTPFGLVRENDSGCPAPGSRGDSPTNPQEMLGANMQLNNLAISCQISLCTISINLLFYGADSSVLAPSATDPNAQCTGSLAGSQYCATSQYSATVVQNF